MTLYEISAEMQECIDRMIDPDTGAIDEEAYSRLQQLQGERDTKIENLACAIKNIRSGCAAIKTEVDKLNTRRKQEEAKADRLEDYLAFILDGEKFKSARVSIGQRTSKAVSVESEGALIDWLTVNGGEDAIRTKPAELRKDVLRKWLDEGREIPGCSIEERHSISIR